MARDPGNCLGLIRSTLCDLETEPGRGLQLAAPTQLSSGQPLHDLLSSRYQRIPRGGRVLFLMVFWFFSPVSDRISRFGEGSIVLATWASSRR